MQTRFMIKIHLIAFCLSLVICGSTHARDIPWTEVISEQSSDTWEVAAAAKLEEQMKTARALLGCRCRNDQGLLSCEKAWIRCEGFAGSFTDCYGRQTCECLASVQPSSD